ncbi:RHS domain-containing protein, partial [Escherichia coli]|nr:RHS domain-containing protein [Escherichia coli]ELC3409446.1 RHS domain-containing protein [Escherichia coli]ELW6977349.1 RHS domain-containing protein [Escherichia coli]ELW7142460.1 RHS domain-containing protein [Escherichia coli]ELW9862891.1 RHS domain-containing protein [Escherichia coli]
YDPTGRITACRSEDERYLASWQYDAAGNLLGRRAGERATAENSVVPFNRLMSYRGVHYRYDEFGRTVEKEGRSGTQSYRYDAEHRMVEVTTARGTYRYVYDALGRRTEKQHISPDGKPYNRTTFLWDGMRLAQESRPEGISSLYIYSDPGSYEPLARVDKAGKEGPNRILYFHTDVNGAPEEMTDSDGKIVWETGYQVWGNTIQEKDHGGVEQNLRYQGQYLDRETGLHYNLHRYYDPDVGRFMVTDPIGLAGGLNLYQYSPNPISWIDPLGLTGEWVNPKDINFSQRTISPHDYADIMRNGGWDWDRSPLRVIDIDGQLVSYDNRRLDAALEAGLDKVKVIRVDPNAPHPDSSTGKTWLQKFRERFRDRRNIKAGGIVPDKGLNSRPERTSRGCK